MMQIGLLYTTHMTTLPDDAALLRRRHLKLPPTVPRAYPCKLQPAQLSEALQLLKQGYSLRYAARLYRVEPCGLRKRLIKTYGKQYDASINRRNSAATILRAYTKHSNSRLAKAAQDWLANNLDALLSLEASYPSNTLLLTDRQESHFSYKVSPSDIENNPVASGVW